MKFVGLEKWKSKVIKNINSKINRLENKSTKNKILGYGILNILLFFSIRVSVFLVEILLYCIGLKMPTVPNFNEFDLLLAQISNTFIVLSLTSALSTSMGTIYWVDIKEEKLVRPALTCFYALTVYLLTSMGISVCAYIFRDNCGLCISFLMSVLCLIILTYSMIDAYFNREKLKTKYRWEYCWTSLLAGSWESYKVRGLRMLFESRKIIDYKKCKKDFDMMRMIEESIKSTINTMWNCGEKNEDLIRTNWRNFLHITIENPTYIFEFTESMKEQYPKISMALYEKTVGAINEIDVDVIYENIELMVLSMDKVNLQNIMIYALKQNIYISIQILLFVIEYKCRMKENKDSNWLDELIDSCGKKIIRECTYKNITYEQFIKILDSIEFDLLENANFQKIDLILNEYVNSKYLWGDLDIKVPLQALSTNDIEKLNDCVKKIENSTLSGFRYKPIKELYFIYLKKDILLVEYCIEYLKKYYELIIHDYRINDYRQVLTLLNLERTYHFRFISEVDEEYLNLIFRREEIDPILPPKMIQDLKDLIYIEL